MNKSDLELIDDIRNGILESFDRLMSKYEKRIYRTALNFVKNENHAMDIVQNVFLKVYRNLQKFRGDAQFKTWLFRIVYNESVNWIKKNKFMFSLDHVEIAVQENIHHEDNDVINETYNALIKGMETLNKKYRLAVVLRYYEGFSIKDIANTLECSEGSVKNILFRSLQKLKKTVKIND